MEIEDEKPSEEIDNDVVYQYYVSASEVVNATMKMVIGECVPGQSVLKICAMADQFILKNIKKKLKKKKNINRGIAFPTCLNVNKIVCHYSPDNNDKTVLKLGDRIRIDLGAHIDGYIAVSAQTIVLTKEKVKGLLGDCFAAADCCFQVALRCLAPGMKNTDVSKAINLVSKNYGVELSEGVLSHRLKRYVIDGSDVIMLKPTPQQTVNEFTIEANQVYALDILISSSQGKLKKSTIEPTVFKRNPESNYYLRTKTSRTVFKEISEFENLPFSTRTLKTKFPKMGIMECWNNSLISEYPILEEAKNDFVVHIKGTVLITRKKTALVTPHTLQPYATEKKIEDPTIIEILKKPLTRKINKKKK